eukprot:TRINITY_DN66646_c0_g1_i1.p1 TRINITY_DN66646_c0_g1~~TRINITY_DN66646_c0_g1_i1.p1  ORF type:complete len:303 (+),score=76.07 TRINITY_DN66646_c0_g1_i1:79-987(+)
MRGAGAAAAVLWRLGALLAAAPRAGGAELPRLAPLRTKGTGEDEWECERWSDCTHRKAACSAMLLDRVREAVGKQRTREMASFRDAYHVTVANCLCRLKVKRMVEIGTRWGSNSNSILQRCNQVRELYAVDPYLGGYSIGDGTSEAFLKMANLTKTSPTQFSTYLARAVALGLQQDHGCRFRLIQALSVDAARKFADGSLDAVFVDGLHTYDGVSADIQAWEPKLRRGGAFLFNDYYAFSRKQMFPGVKRAVDQWARARGVRLQPVDKFDVYAVPRPVEGQPWCSASSGRRIGPAKRAHRRR